MKEYVTRHDLRSMLRRYVILASLFVFAISASFNMLANASSIDSQRAACDRANDSRVSELRQRQNLVQNARERAQNPRTSEEGQRALIRARTRRRELIASQADVAVSPGSVVVNCPAAYPRPFPLSLFD